MSFNNINKIFFISITISMKCFNDYIIDTKILKNNANNIKNCIGNNCKFCAVVKANAYGIGAESVCKSLYGIADFFAVANLKEALSIRVFDKTTPILILGYILLDDLQIVSNNNISISVGSYEQIQEIVKSKVPIKIHIQINTGLNRFGIKTITEYKKVLKVLKVNNFVKVEGVYSHFATKSQDVNFVNRQYLRFLQFKNIFIDNDVIYHIANSFGATYSNKFCLDMVRTGFVLYGYAKNNIGNKPITTIKTQIINIANVRRGDTIGYDRTFVVDKNMKIAVVPIGYADGLNRRLSNNFSLFVNNIKCPIIGRICMDVAMIDISKIVDVKVGTEVLVLGKSDSSEITLKEYADAIGTSDYEVLCNFNYKRANYIVK